jgi:hypothetical protein
MWKFCITAKSKFIDVRNDVGCAEVGCRMRIGFMFALR